MLHHLDDPSAVARLSADQREAILRRGTRLRRRRRALQIGIPAALVAVVVAAALVSVPKPQAIPSPATSLTPTAPPTPAVSRATPGPAPTGPYEALMARGTTLVAVDAHGRERAVRDLAPLRISEADLRYAYVSTAGWLTFEPGGSPSTWTIGHEFINLLDPTARPVVVKGGFDQRAWSPDGTRLATTTGTSPVVIDAATGAKTTLDLQGRGLPGGGPSLIWTADGTGIVVAGGTPAHLFVAPVDGGPLQSAIPDLWERYRHSITIGGLQLDHAACFMPTCPAGEVRVLDPTGAETTLYSGGLPGTKLADATLSRDGQSAFLLLASAVPNRNRLPIARIDPGGDPTVLATVPVVSTAGASLGISPDDATLLVHTYTNPKAPNPTSNYYVVPLDGNPAYATGGIFAGWVPTDVVNAIAAAR